MLAHFFLNDPFKDFTRYRSQTDGPIARWGMTATFLVNWGDGSLQPDSWDLHVINSFSKESGEGGGRGIRSFLEYPKMDVVQPH